MNNFRVLYSSLDDNSQKFLRYLAFALTSIDEKLLKDVAFKCDIKITKAREILKMLRNEMFLRDENIFWDRFYLLQASFHNFLIGEIALLPEIEIDEMNQFYQFSTEKYNDAILNHNRSTIINYLKHGIPSRIYSPSKNNIRYSGITDYIRKLSEDWYERARFKELIYFIEEEAAQDLFDDIYYKSLYTLESEDIDKAKDFALSYNFTSTLNDVKEKIAFYDFLRGDVEKYNAALQPASIESKYFYAFIKLSEKKFPESLKLFNSAMKSEGVTYPKNPFYGFAYAWVLKLNGKDSNLKKLEKLKDEYPHWLHSPSLIPLICLDYNCRENKDAISGFCKIDTMNIQSDMMKYLTLLMFEYFKLRELDERELAFIVRFKSYGYRTLLLLGDNIFEIYKDLHLEHSIGLSSFIPQYEFIPEWERLLNNLIEKDFKTDTPLQEEKEARIIYIVDSSGFITPKLQKKLRSGSNWSKGRDMSIQTFYYGVPEMDSVDKEISECVDQVVSSGWRSEVHFIINPSKALPILKNKSRLFYNSEPPVPVDIVEEKPYISISRIKNNYYISTNYIQGNDSKDLTSIYFNGNTQIKMVEVNLRQKEILKSLQRINEFPVEAKDKLVKLISVIAKDITVHSDLVASTDDVIRQSSDSTIIVQLLPKGNSFRAELFVKPLGAALPYCKPGMGIRTVVGQSDGKSIQATRDYSRENENLLMAEELFIECDSIDEKNHIYTITSAFECLDILEKIKDSETIKVEWPEGVKLKLRGKAGMSDFSCSLKSKLNWFEISGNLKVGEHLAIELDDLLEQYTMNPGRRFIELADGEYVSLTEELRKALNTFDSITVKDKGELKISQFIAPSLKVFEKSGVTIEGDNEFGSFISRIDDASSREYPVPQRLKATLREYQEDGFRWMAKLSEWGSGACLADDMGLGKTLQSIAMLLHRAEKGASLIVAPASVLLNWQNEISRFAPSLNCLVLNTGQSREKMIKDSDSFDVVLTTYGLLITQSELAKKDWNMVVLDEAHTIKNRDTKMSKAAMKLKGDFRLILTGTPIQNHLSEIWNLFQFMNPGLLGSYEHFFNNFILPVENEKDVSRRQQLKNMISPFLLRRTKNEVLNDLPGKTEIIISVEQTKEENLFYEKLRNDAEQRLNNKEMTAIQTLAEITRLRQAASNLRLVDNNISKESSKMEAFFKLYDDITDNDHRALVFSQFTSHLALLREQLDKRNIPYLYLDGSTPVPDRLNLVKKFQTGTQPLFLISLKAGGLGLNLTAADFVIHMDPWWNPAIEDQASDRAYRIGQKRPVTIYRLITKNTIEEKILDLHHTKKNIADSLLEGTNISNKLTRDDLIELLKSF